MLIASAKTVFRSAISLALIVFAFQFPALVYAANPPKLESLDGVINRAMDLILPFAGIVALMMFFYGGYMFMFSSGDPQKLTQARGVLTWVVVGVAFVLAFGYVLQFFFGRLGIF